MLSIDQLSIHRGKNSICQNLTVDIQAGECWVVLGRNGAGKTTFLKSIASLYTHYQGLIEFQRKNVLSISPRERAKNVGLALQENECEFPISVKEYLAHGLYPYADFTLGALHPKVQSVLAECRLDPYADRMVGSLSGGELKRAALATLLVQSPSVILLDEPLNHLDLEYQTHMLDLFYNRTKFNKQCLMMTTHDINAAYKYADKVIFMWGEGRVTYGSKKEMLIPPLLSELYAVDIRQQETANRMLFYTV